MTENTPIKLSVAMITYNHARFIAQAIESVLMQKVNFDYEIVIGEDCSTDDTRSIVVDFQRRYPDRIVTFLRDRNIGCTGNLKATIAACRGQYVALLEGDDYWVCEDKLQRQVDFLECHPGFGICCHRVRLLNEADTSSADLFPSVSAGEYTIEDLLQRNFIMTCSTVLKRGFIGSLPPWFSEMKLGDWPLFAIVATRGQIELMDEVMAVYRVHSGGIWSSQSLAVRLRAIIKMMVALDEHLRFRYTRTIRKTLAGFQIDLALIAREEGKRIETVRHLISCIRYGGLSLDTNFRTFAGLSVYALIGSWYKVFSRGAG